MKECLVIGKTNVGKTLFTLNFADYLGLKSLRMDISFPDGSTAHYHYDLATAVAELTDSEPHKTRCLQSIVLQIPAGKGKKRFVLTDTSGLIDHVHGETDVRKAIAQTLAKIRQADVVLHIVDASAVGKQGAVEALGEIDYQIAQFAQMRKSYLLLANKMDLPDSREALFRLQGEFPGHRIIPVSALHRKGFREVKQFVTRNL